MSEKSSHKELSVDDFYNLLKSRESDKSWTLGQLIEYERRGPRDFDHDIKLVSTLDSYISEQNQKYSEILKPYKEIISKALAGSISQSTRHIFEQYASQSAKMAALMPKLEAQKFDLPKTVFQDLVELEPRVLDKPLSSSSVQKIIVEGLHEMSDYHGGFLKQIAANTKWDWKQWTLFGLAGVAAVASIIALFT